MADPIDLTHFHDRSRAFLRDLSDNNDREWFRAHKARYDSDLKRPAERLLADLTPDLEALGQAPVKTKVFRPHRDVRFTEDKTPYQTHLHILWSHDDGRGWFFGLSPDYATAGAGLMHLTGETLTKWREAVAGPDGAALQKLLDTNGWRVDAPELKRVPSPFAADHPNAALLLRKGLVAWRDNLDTALQEDPRAALHRAFADLAPLQDWLLRNVVR